MKTYPIIILMSLLLNSCNDCDLPGDSDSGIIVSEFDILNDCVRLDEYKDTYIIRTQDEYDSIKIKKTNNENCTTYTLNPVEFNNYTLLGIKACGTCEVSFDRNVTKDDHSKKYIYTIKVNDCGPCKELSCSMNWVLVPKLPDDWTVEFKE